MIKLNADNVNITKSINETNSRLADLEKSLSYSHERQDVFDGRLKSVEDKLFVYEHLETQMNALEQKLTAMEQNARQCNLEICYIPERRGENLISIAESLGGIIACPIRASDIVSIHRVPHADSKIKRPKNVIVKLTNRMLRDNVISACRSTKGLDSSKLSISGPPATIYVNEHLTINNKLLFRQCRENARKQAYKYVWVKHGTILRPGCMRIFPMRNLWTNVIEYFDMTETELVVVGATAAVCWWRCAASSPRRPAPAPPPPRPGRARL
ncbi:uncharacterized protein LOC135072130 [Ostrinia nubilalis]|uniref:uncharacterized protein LOC135072130 n=1 Tax=Ostrinia nubilalis TaxID=29057 RepID=UPI0030825EDC